MIVENVHLVKVLQNVKNSLMLQHGGFVNIHILVMLIIKS